MQLHRKLIWYVHFLTSCNHVCEWCVSWKSPWKRIFWVLENAGICSLQVLESPGNSVLMSVRALYCECCFHWMLFLSLICYCFEQVCRLVTTKDTPLQILMCDYDAVYWDPWYLYHIIYFLERLSHWCHFDDAIDIKSLDIIQVSCVLQLPVNVSFMLFNVHPVP